MAGKENCHCGPCLCDGTVARQFEQTAGRYNDQSAFASAESQKTFVHMSSQFQATAQNTLEQHGLANMTLQLRAIQGQPGAA